MRRGRVLGIEDRMRKFGVDSPAQDSPQVYRDNDTHKYYCRQCLNEVPFRQNCPNCGREIDWSTTDIECSPTSPPNPRFRPRRYV